MAELAKIGFAADSSGLVAAEQALNRLTPAAQRTEAAAACLAIGATAAAAAGLQQRLMWFAPPTRPTDHSTRKRLTSTRLATHKKLADVQKRINDLTGVSKVSDNKTQAEVFRIRSRVG